MIVQNSSKYALWQRTAKFITKFLILNSLVLLPLSTATLAAEDGVYRILIVRGEWYERQWDREFNQHFLESMAEAEERTVQVSYQNLGIEQSVAPLTREFYADNIASIIQEQKVNLVVAVLPTAIEFVLEIEAIDDVPKVLVLPGAGLEQNTPTKSNIRVVASRADESIRKTIEIAKTLNPETTNVAVFSGAGQTDLSYLARARRIAAQYFDEMRFTFNSGLPVAEVKDYVSGLESDSLVLMLPYSGFSNGDYVNSFDFIPELSEASSVPLYSIVDGWLGSGIAGGHFYGVDKYAIAASSAASSLLHQDSLSKGEQEVFGGPVFDYNQVSRWSLAVENLDEPYVLLNSPRSILDDYAGFIYTIALMGFLLLLALCLQFIMLKRSESDKLKLRASEKQARENEVRFQLLTRNSLDVIWTWDGVKRRTTYCSPSIRQLLDYTPEEFLSLPIRKIMTDDSTETAMRKVFSKDSGAQVFEVDLIKKNGDKVSCEIAAQPIDDSEESNNWVGVTRDISQRKEAEKERLALQDQVRQAQKFESLGTLAGGIAHDFNNILGVVMGLTELLKLKLTGNDEALNIAEKLMTTTDRAKMMVGQILSFSRQSVGTQTATDINELLLESFQLMQTGVPKSVSLNFEGADQVVNVLADSNQLSQVFINTLTNAFEAIDEREGEISVGISELELVEQSKLLHGKLKAGRYAQVRITDNGSGLTEDEIEKMFDPFQTSKDLGNGMGLAIVRGIIIGHDGAIDIKSQKGKGTTVFIYLPLTQLTAEAEELIKIKTEESVKSTILLVDDQRDLLETMSLMLKELGHECICCDDPNMAIDVIGDKSLDIDIVITDYSMPNISGLDIQQFSSKHRPNVPVILATGYSERLAHDDYLNENPHYILNKPFGFKELKEAIAEALDQP